METEEKVIAGHSVLHYALAGALKKVTPFMETGNGRENLTHVWFEAAGGRLSVTTSNGHCIAHATLEANWPDGQWLLEGTACKVLANSYYQADVAVEIQDEAVAVDKQVLPIADSKWVDYQRFYQEVQEGMEGMAVMSRRPLQRVLREHGGTVVGLKITQTETRLYVAREDQRDFGLETVACEILATQLATGTARVAFDKDKVNRALRHCGDWVTLKLQGEGKPALIEGTDYWQVLMPLTTFPSEVNFSQTERESLEWAIEMLRSIRKGQVQAVVQLGKSGMSVSWEPQPERTAITFKEGE